MDSRQAFKIGFLARCAEEGLTGEQVRERLQKAASLLGSLPDLATTAAVTLPVMAGAGLGYMAHRSAGRDVDEDDIRKRELIEELRHYARRARDQQKVKSLRAVTGV
jgi:hypothetical protein